MKAMCETAGGCGVRIRVSFMDETNHGGNSGGMGWQRQTDLTVAGERFYQTSVLALSRCS